VNSGKQRKSKPPYPLNRMELCPDIEHEWEDERE